MSSKNRGAISKPYDFYPTPESTIHKLLSNHKLSGGGILEPCAGNGVIVKTIKNFGYENKIYANEIRVQEKKSLYENGAFHVTFDDYLKMVNTYDDVQTVITNPPFSLAQEFIEQSFKLYPDAEIIMLLRLAFLESKRRSKFWQQHPVNKLYVLSERPSFTGKGTDSTAYAWFVWDGSDKQEIKII